MTIRRVALLITAVLFGFPLVALVELSLHAEGEGLGTSTLAMAADPHFENYAEALRRMGDFPRLLFNTTVITAVSILGQLFVCSFAGYAFARLRFRGRNALFLLVVATMLVPDHVAAIPRFLLFRSLGLVDTWYPLVLPTILGGAPFFIFLFRQAFVALGPELDEAARIDGATPTKAYWYVFLPLVRPMVGAVAIFTFLATWNDFWAPLIYVLSPEKRTLTLALAGFSRTFSTSIEHLMAASAVVLAPCLLIYFLTQGVFLRGVRVAANKG